MKYAGKLLPLVLLSLSLNLSYGQPPASFAVLESRPYKLMISGKQVTVRSTKNIKHIMVWTTGGNRVAEHKDVNAPSFTVEIPVNHKMFFLMVTLSDGKLYTEKIGIR